MFGSTATSSGVGTTGSLFGSLNTSKPATGGLFGSTASTNVGLSPFGAASSAGQTKSLFGNTTAGASGGLFGNMGSTSGGLFANSAAGGSGGLFGSSTQPASGGLFGSSSTTGSGLFGNKPVSGFGSLGQSAGSGGLFGGTGTSLVGGGSSFSLLSSQPQTNPSVNQQTLNQLVLHTALSNPQLFPDERNSVMASWNQLQASWGFGKAYYASNAQPLELTPSNVYCRFKTVSYCALPSSKDEDGEVCLSLNKAVKEIVDNQQVLIDTLFSKVFQGNQAVSITVTTTKPVTDTLSEVVFYVKEKMPNGHSKRIAASKLYQFLLQPNQSRELTSLGVQSFRPNKTISQQDLDIYLNTPPAGLDKFLWQQAIANNPDPKRLLPVPILGFKQLSQRLDQQTQMNQQHKSRVAAMHEELASLRSRQAVSQAKLEEHKHKIVQLSHKLLNCVALIERARKMDYPLQDEEYTLQRQLEIIYQQLFQPTKLRSQLSELVSQARLGSGSIVKAAAAMGANGEQSSAYSLSDEHKQQLTSFLKQQQEGISNLIHMMKTTSNELKLIQQNLSLQSKLC